ncbi:MAG TPA: thioredoxin domain-containing protein, partial [Phenylobacterium sp.]
AGLRESRLTRLPWRIPTSMPTRRSIAAAALAAVLGTAMTLAGCAKRAGPDASAAPDDMTLGRPNARVKVVEYASASCPHCARFALDIFPTFKAKYVDTGKVSFTLKEYLTEPEVLAAGGFLLARCAGKDRYFPVLEAVFRDQAQMVQTGDYRTSFQRIAKAPGGLTDAQFEACMKDTAAAKALAERANRHVKVDKIGATPTFVINGRRFEGEMTMPELDAAIAKAQG